MIDRNIKKQNIEIAKNNPKSSTPIIQAIRNTSFLKIDVTIDILFYNL
jgi:hypothetical protein